MGPPIFIGGNDQLAAVPRPISLASMGPPIFIGGNTHETLAQFDDSRLQWGHRFSSVEMTPRWDTHFKRAWKLQWGHRFSSVEICGLLAAHNGRGSFNGATDFHRWKCNHRGPGNRPHKASMGPPIFIGGNSPASCDAFDLQRASWGHRFSSVEIRAHAPSTLRNPPASMGPPIFIGGNERHENRNHWRRRASMGPPIFIGGNSVPAPRSRTSPTSFNGATDFHRWKSVSCSSTLSTSCALQWGHRFSSVEIGPAPLYMKKYFGFNGATDFHRWKCLAVLHQENVAMVLQWGHRFSSVEIAAQFCDALGVVVVLQWGHRFSSVEMSCLLAIGTVRDRASMGPPIFIGGNVVPPTHSGMSSTRFNGATDFHRWK